MSLYPRGCPLELASLDWVMIMLRRRLLLVLLLHAPVFLLAFAFANHFGNSIDGVTIKVGIGVLDELYHLWMVFLVEQT